MNIGDCVRSNIVNIMIGEIVKLLDDNHAIVLMKNKEVYIDLNYWHKV